MIARTSKFAVSAVTLTLAILGALVVLAPAANADFRITDFSNQALRADGSEEALAGGRPYSTVNSISFPVKAGGGGVDGYVRDVNAALPPGFVGNPLATPRCTKAELAAYVTREAECPLASQVGLVEVDFLVTQSAFTFPISEITPVYSVQPPPGVTAEFGFVVANVPVRFTAGIGYEGGEYRTVAKFDKISQGLPVTNSVVTLWADPTSSSHDSQRGFLIPGLPCAKANIESPGSCAGNPVIGLSSVPFLTNPTSCGPQVTDVEADSWENPGAFISATYTAPEPITGCERLKFEPQMRTSVDGARASGPAGLSVNLHFPQNEDPDGLATAHLKNAKVSLPEGMAISPSSAGGLGGCSDAELGLDEAHRLDPVACPDAAKIGTVEASTPLLEESLKGGVYLRSQNSNDPESGEMFRLALALENPERGIVIKLPGQVKVNKDTGRITTEFNSNPQFPVQDVSLNLKSGARAPLQLPQTCGTKTIEAQLTSWAGQSANLQSSFQVSSGCDQSGFSPKLDAGTANPVAGAHSPFTLRVTREDGQQNISAIAATLPEGMLAKLAGVALCGEADANSGNCPAASQVGTTTVGAGAGSNPIYVPQPGKAPTAAYLAGPYKGAPYSLVVKVPAQAGPFDLGTVTVRNALQVDPTTAQVTAKSDPLPQILQGIPIAYRDIRVDINRDNFTLNPTSCDPMSVDGTITSAQGKSANVSSRFQVGSCERLAFKPALKLKVSGATKRGKYPKLRAELRAKPGEANIGRVSVALPHSEFLAQEHIKTICTRVQFAAEQCPAGSIYGKATAWSPLLDKPLSGPVYLRSSSNPLPDLVVALKGQIDIDLAGRIDSVNGGIRNTFDLVPDAPVSKFVLEMQGGKKGLLVNSRNLCAKGAGKATVKMTGQNGKAHDFNPVLGSSCGGKSRKKGK